MVNMYDVEFLAELSKVAQWNFFGDIAFGDIANIVTPEDMAVVVIEHGNSKGDGREWSATVYVDGKAITTHLLVDLSDDPGFYVALAFYLYRVSDLGEVVVLVNKFNAKAVE